MEEKQLNQKKFNLSKLDIAGIILVLVFLPIIIINSIIVIKGMVNPEKVPTVFGYGPLLVISDSMDIEYGDPGAFNKNDLIIIKEVDVNDLKENDIITYIGKDKKFVTHRIKRFEEIDGVTVIRTKGDFSVSEDEPVYFDQVQGIYVTRIPGMGKLVDFIQKPVGVIILLGIPILIYLAIDFFLKSKDKEKVDAKNAELEAEIARLKAEQAAKEEQSSSNN